MENMGYANAEGKYGVQSPKEGEIRLLSDRCHLLSKRNW